MHRYYWCSSVRFVRFQFVLEKMIPFGGYLNACVKIENSMNDKKINAKNVKYIRKIATN